MRLSRSRLTAVLVIGVALAAVPGVAITRVGGREGSARMATRGGLHRLSASKAVVHGYDDTASGIATAGDPASDSTDLRDAGPPGLPPGATAVGPPSGDSMLLDGVPLVTLHSADSFLRPPGRAPPAR
jgi:hypothetical protein